MVEAGGTSDQAAAGKGAAELERRIAASRRAVDDARREELLHAARDAVADAETSQVQLGGEMVETEASHRKWQAVHRYIRAVPYRDDPAEPRPRQWQRAVAMATDIGELDLLAWTVQQVDLAWAEAARKKSGEASEAGPTYLALLKAVADRKRKARAELTWARTASANGWITCQTSTLGANLIALHAASIHSRDNPDYNGPRDFEYRPE